MDLSGAIRIGDLDRVVSIIEAGGVDINAQTSSGKTLLMQACIGGHVRIVQYLCHKGAELNIKDIGGFTALTYAASNKRIDVCKELISRHAKMGMPPSITPKPVANWIA